MSELDLSIVIPVHNEELNLAPLSVEIAEALVEGSWTYEIVFVDDGSTDRSRQSIRELRRGDERIRMVALGHNRGQSAALYCGIRAARGDLIATMDADLQNDPADLPGLLDFMTRFDLISGIRTDRQDTAARRIASRIANRVRRMVTGDSLIDIGCSLKVFRAQHLRALPGFDGLHRFLPALLEAKGVRVHQVGVTHRPRTYGVSKYGIGNRLVRGLYDLVGVRWLMSRWFFELSPTSSAIRDRSTTPPTRLRNELRPAAKLSALAASSSAIPRS